MRKSLVALILALACLTGCSQSWSEYRSGKGGYSVEVPGRMKESSDSVSTPAGNITFNTAMVERRSSAYCAAYSDFPEFAVRGRDPKDLLNGARDGALRNIDGKLEKESWIKVDGNPGLEITFKSPKKKIKAKARLILVKNRLYQILAGQSESSYSETDVDKFLNSFKLRPVL